MDLAPSGEDDGNQHAFPAAPESLPAIDMHTAEIRQFSQWATDMNARWAMWSNEQRTKGAIVGLLTKLEDKYQVRG
jgi:hypothetical protein